MSFDFFPSHAPVTVYMLHSNQIEYVAHETNFALAGKDKFNLTHGSILGISHDFFNVLSFRHQARHPNVKNTYFVGASVHPGTGVPIAIAGSRLVTETVLSDLGRALPTTYDEEPNPKTNMLDVKKPISLAHRMEGWLPNLVLVLLGAVVAYVWSALRF